MVQRSSGGKAAIPAEGKSTIAGDSGNDSSGSIHTADAAVLRVGDEEIAVAIKGDFTREIQPGAGGRTAVAAVTAAVITPRPAASKCGDNPCGSIHAADLIIELIDKKDVSFSVYGDPVGQIVEAYVQRSVFCRAIIAIKRLHSAAGHHAYLAGPVHRKYSIPPGSSDIDIPGRVRRHRGWHWQVRRKRRNLVGPAPGVGMDNIFVNPGCCTGLCMDLQSRKQREAQKQQNISLAHISSLDQTAGMGSAGLRCESAAHVYGALKGLLNRKLCLCQAPSTRKFSGEMRISKIANSSS